MGIVLKPFFLKNPTRRFFLFVLVSLFFFNFIIDPFSCLKFVFSNYGTMIIVPWLVIYDIFKGDHCFSSFLTSSLKCVFPCSDETSTLPAVRSCSLSEIVTSLLDLAARYLVLHGRLVYWLPVYRPR